MVWLMRSCIDPCAICTANWTHVKPMITRYVATSMTRKY